MHFFSIQNKGLGYVKCFMKEIFYLILFWYLTERTFFAARYLEEMQDKTQFHYLLSIQKEVWRASLSKRQKFYSYTTF